MLDLVLQRSRYPETAEKPDLASFDVLLVNSSGGKDSQAQLDYVVELADKAGVRDRIVVVHADLGEVEWDGTLELAREQAEHYGLRFEVVGREEKLLDQVRTRKQTLVAQGRPDAPAWPSSAARYCTSDQKTSQVKKLMTQLVREAALDRPVRILNMLGIRAAESAARSKKQWLHRDSASNGKREVVRWLPVFNWSTEQVWQRIAESGVRYHEAYDLGMSRLSCAFCVLASRCDLKIAARHNPDLAAKYVAVEEEVGASFRQDLSIKDLLAEVQAEEAAA